MAVPAPTRWPTPRATHTGLGTSSLDQDPL
jgi:hypothetical protein